MKTKTPPIRLRFLPANQAFAFVLGDQLIPMDGRRLFQTKPEAWQAASAAGLLPACRDGIVHSKG